MQAHVQFLAGHAFSRIVPSPRVVALARHDGHTTIRSMAVSGWEERLFRRPVAWTRGHGCGELAALLTDAGALRVRGNVAETCIVRRVGLLVTRKLPGTLDLTSVAVPVGFDARAIRSVVAAVSGGPHSALAARLARRLGTALGLPALMACAYREAVDRAGAEDTLRQLALEGPGIPH